MPRPGSHKYDTKRARLRKHLENEGEATGKQAGQEANRRLQQDPDKQGRVRTERGLGPKGERESGTDDER